MFSMTYRPNRAWRFSHPNLDSGTSGLSTTHTGAIAMAEGGESIRQSILLLLSTVPGERVMRTEYGCDLFRVLFSPNDDTTAGLAIHYVRQAIRRWEPRVDIVRLDARRAPSDPALLEIRLEYSIRRTGQQDLLVYTVSLNGDRG
jgi:phage baseplate assembly protein W